MVIFFCRNLGYVLWTTQGAGRKTTLALWCFGFQAEVNVIVLYRNFNFLIRYHKPS
jgi:hypothetical protein